MNSTASDVLAFVKENDVKFIRLGFCDPLGVQKNCSIMAAELPDAFENGVSFDAHAISGFCDITRSDLLLRPDPATLAMLPWRPGPGRVVRFYCDIVNPDGSAFAHDGRSILKNVVRRCDQMGFTCHIGAECEFYLFKTGEDGDPTEETLDKGGYLDISPLDKGENIRREICLTLEEMGIRPESSHHEQGPGQNEVDLKVDDALASADHLVTLKSVVKEIALRNGLYASFMPKPIAEEAGSGMHINLSLAQNGRNIFKDAAAGVHSAAAESFIAGILSKTAEMTLFLNPIANSYERFGVFEAPAYVSWSHQNRSQLIRIPAASGERVRMELRSPDPAMNPYLAFALILTAGLDGIEHGLPLPPALDANLYEADESVTDRLIRLPDCMETAIGIAERSDFVQNVLGGTFLQTYAEIKRGECAALSAAADKAAFQKERYFCRI